MPRKRVKVATVRMLSIVAGPSHSGKPGDILTVDEKTARAWEAGKYAVIISGGQPETAMTSAPENAMERSGEAREEING